MRILEVAWWPMRSRSQFKFSQAGYPFVWRAMAPMVRRLATIMLEKLAFLCQWQQLMEIKVTSSQPARCSKHKRTYCNSSSSSSRNSVHLLLVSHCQIGHFSYLKCNGSISSNGLANFPFPIFSHPNKIEVHIYSETWANRRLICR